MPIIPTQPTLPDFNNIAKDDPDRKYFILTPQIVWALCPDPFVFTLWTVVKMIAGESGECILATPDLADLAMQSAGKVSTGRKYLLSQGLLIGQFRRDPGYPQPVWHLSIPDLWEQNIRWRKTYDKLRDRIFFKRSQRRQMRTSVHLMKAPSGEEGISPGDGGGAPDETKKILSEILQEERLAQTWQTALAQLQLCTTRTIYDNWLRGLHLVNLDPNHGHPTATILCSAEYVREWVKTRLDTLLRRAVADVAGLQFQELTITYTVPPTKGDRHG
jgi:hypothetical protein